MNIGRSRVTIVCLIPIGSKIRHVAVIPAWMQQHRVHAGRYVNKYRAEMVYSAKKEEKL